MKYFDKTFKEDILMKIFDETFWGNILGHILMKRFGDIFWWDILMKYFELYWPFMTFDDLWYGDDIIL